MERIEEVEGEGERRGVVDVVVVGEGDREMVAGEGWKIVGEGERG